MSQKSDSTLTSDIAGRYTAGVKKWDPAELEAQLTDLVDSKINNDKKNVAGGVAGLSAVFARLLGSSATWRVFNVEDYGAVHDGVGGVGTDDTAAIQAATNAAFAAGGGIVFFPLPAPENEYLISGALQTSVNGTNPNCQIYIPLTRFGTSDMGARIEFVGEVATSFYVDQVAGTINQNTNKVVLRSTITGSGTKPAVFGTPTYTGVFSNRNHTYVSMRNLTIKTRTNTGGTHFAGQMCGVNFGRLGSFDCDYLSIETTSTLAVMADPTTPTYGIIFPEELNFAFMNVGYLRVLGYNKGIVPGEHMNAQAIYIGWCKNGLVCENAQQHGIYIARLSVEVTTNMIVMSNNTPLHIGQFVPEFINSGSFPAWCWTNRIIDIVGSPDGQISIGHTNVGHAFVGGYHEGFYCNDYSKVSTKFFNARDVSRDPITLATTSTWGVFRAKKAKVTLTANAVITMAEIAPGDDVTLYYTQDGTGGRTLTIAGTVVTITATAGASGVVRGYYNGTTWTWI